MQTQPLYPPRPPRNPWKIAGALLLLLLTAPCLFSVVWVIFIAPGIPKRVRPVQPTALRARPPLVLERSEVVGVDYQGRPIVVCRPCQGMGMMGGTPCRVCGGRPRRTIDTTNWRYGD